MKSTEETIICRLKEVRLARKLSQGHLAEQVGIKRQAIYDIESGKYLPNTALALRLARRLGCTVEDLFADPAGEAPQPVALAEGADPDSGRVALARVRGRLVGYPLAGRHAVSENFQPAQGLLDQDESKVKMLCPPESLDHAIFLLGCDPAFSILGAHVGCKAPHVQVHCRFASSQRALTGLAAGHAHLAGTHLHNRSSEQANVLLARKLLGGSSAWVVAFSFMEEGLMVAPGNPHHIRSVADLAGTEVRLVNREPGAALRTLLDDYMQRLGIPPAAMTGYENQVAGHVEGAQWIAFGQADAALGLRAVARAWGLDFVTLETVRCDLVIPEDLVGHPSVAILLETLNSLRMRRELGALAGYEASCTGEVIARL